MKKQLETFNTAYRNYKKEIGELDRKTFISICNDFSEFLMEELLSGNIVQLPHNLGTFQVVGEKVIPKVDEEGNIQNLSPDWKKTNDLWEKCEECKERKQLVFHFNEHSDHVRYRFLWSRKGCSIRNFKFYTFKPARRNQRELSKRIFDGKEYLIKNKNYSPKYKK